VLPRHRPTVQAQLAARADAAPAFARPGAARWRSTRLRRLAAPRLHPDGRRVSARQRRHPLRAGFAPVVGTPRGTMSDLRAEHDGQVLACGTAGSLLVLNGSAWHGHTAKHVERAAPVAPRRVDSAGRAYRDRLRGPTRDARATRPTRAVCARAL